MSREFYCGDIESSRELHMAHGPFALSLNVPYDHSN